jgi:hypothetical protein
VGKLSVILEISIATADRNIVASASNPDAHRVNIYRCRGVNKSAGA